jgi:hypothetical protein
MRASILLLPIALTTLASMPIAAQEAPRVIFCTGQCTAIDDKGVRISAPKGTVLRENQRLETGPGAYAQLKVGRDVALGVGEGAQVRFDQKSVRGGDVVILDQGRIRMLDGAAMGKPGARTLELRTTDGRFGLQGADIEVKTPRRGTSGDSRLTFVKLNVGDAQLLNPQGGSAIVKDSVQAFTAGTVVTDRSISVTDVAMSQARTSATPVARPLEPVGNLPPVSFTALTPALRNDLVLPGLTPLGGTPLNSTILSPTSVQAAPVVSSADQLLTKPVTDPTTLAPTTLTKLVTTQPIATTTTTATTTTVVKTQLILAPVTTTILTPVLTTKTTITPR